MKNQNNLTESKIVKRMYFSYQMKKRNTYRAFLGITFVMIMFNAISQDTTSKGSWIYKGNKTIIQGDQVLNIFEDQLKNIWVLSSDKSGENVLTGKINLFDGRQWNYFKDQPDIFNYTFSKFSFSNTFIRDDGMICKYDGNKWTLTSGELLKDEFLKKEYNLPKKEKIVETIYDKYNRLWLTTEKGLLLCENGSFRRFMQDIDFSKKTPYSYYSYNNFTPDLYLSCTKGIFHFEQNQFQFCKSVSGWIVYSRTYIDSSNVYYWVLQGASKPYILLKLSNGKWNEFRFEKKFSLPKLKMGPNQCLWFIYNRGIGYIDLNNQVVFLPVDRSKIPPRFIFNDVVFTQEGNAWISCIIDDSQLTETKRWDKAGGFMIFWDGKSFTYYDKEDDLPRIRSMYIRDLLVDRKNNLWMVTGFPMADIFATEKTARIVRRSNNSWDIFDQSNGFTARFYNKIFEDSKGRIWIGSSNNGIFLYEYNDSR